MSDKGIIDIQKDLYETLNKPVLTAAISGKIYKYAAPLNDDSENVIILVNGIKGSHESNDLQPAIANINIEIPAFKNGTPKEERFDTISTIIRDLLVNNRQASKGFYFDISNETLIPEQKQNITYYYNFLLTIQKI